MGDGGQLPLQRRHRGNEEVRRRALVSHQALTSRGSTMRVQAGVCVSCGFAYSALQAVRPVNAIVRRQPSEPRRSFVTKFLSIMPALRVSNLQQSIDWYTGVLGFVAQGRTTDDGGSEYCFVGAGDVAVLLSTGSHLGGPPMFTGTVYFRVDGVDSLYARVSSRAEVVWPLETQVYGTREFGIRDPDGYVLAFAEAMAANAGAAPDRDGD